MLKKGKRIAALLSAAVFLCLLFAGCASVSPDASSEPEGGGAASSSVLYAGFRSFGELEAAFRAEGEDGLPSLFAGQGADRAQAEAVEAMIEAALRRNNVVPYLDGEKVELRNEEGFSNVTFFAYEKYELPCVFCHPKVENGENLYVTVTCIPEHFLKDPDWSTASDLVKKMSPGYPNLDDFGTRCKAVYNKNVKLRDRDVTAMVYEYDTDKRNSTIFVYDNLLVEVRNDPEVWGEDWFSKLSFGGF